MSTHDDKSTEGGDRMNPRFHREMVQRGWRLPQTDAEVRAAEEFVAEMTKDAPTPQLEVSQQTRSDGSVAKRGDIVAQRMRARIEHDRATQREARGADRDR